MKVLLQFTQLVQLTQKVKQVQYVKRCIVCKISPVFSGLGDDINCTIIFIKLIVMIISEKSLLRCDRVTYNEIHVI